MQKHWSMPLVKLRKLQMALDLDFYPMRYEICPADIIYTFGAYGMPTRFSHWSFGKQFFKMKLHYDFGLSKIYELVINSNPCYAFFLDSNSLIQNKLIVAHVLAHCDFFKNNVRFQNTKRDMVESMAATAERIREYEIEYGTRKWKLFSTQCWQSKNISTLHLLRPKLAWNMEEEEEEEDQLQRLHMMIYGHLDEKVCQTTRTKKQKSISRLSLKKILCYLSNNIAGN